jgi:putative CocE/NonD family hydrolase
MRRTGLSLLLAALVLAVTATGAQAGKVTQIVPFESTAPDGTTLSGHVYLPEGPRPFATVLDYGPYFGNARASTEAWQLEDGTLDDTLGFQPFIDAGFAVALVSMRGTGRSGGCFALGTEVDRSDGHAVVEGLAREPWSNGKIGMYGVSYDGWSQWLTVAAAPPSLKAVAPISGVIDLWSLLGRRGAPLFVAGASFAPVWTALTSVGSIQQGDPQRLGCTDPVANMAENADLAVSGNRTPWYEARDLRPLIRDSKIPALVSNGLMTLGAPLTSQEGHILQVEGLWDLLRPDRTRFLLGHWPHALPHPYRKDYASMVVAWFDHYLRGGPQTVAPGVAEYQDIDEVWHASSKWPPPSRPLTLRFSKERLVREGEPVETSEARLQSSDHDPGLRVDPDDGDRPNTSTCGPHQALFVSEPMPEDVRLAGNFEVELTLSSSQPGGHLAVLLHRAPGDGSCPDQGAAEVGRALLDLRHFKTPGRAQDFPIATPTTFTFTSHPLTATIPKGQRLVAAIGGGAWEIASDPLKPLLTVHTGQGIPGRITLPVARGESPAQPREAQPVALPNGRTCRSRRHFRIRLTAPRWERIARATVTVAGRRRVANAGRRTAVVDLRGLPKGRFTVRIAIRTTSGRVIRRDRRYRTCTPGPRR